MYSERRTTIFCFRKSTLTEVLNQLDTFQWEHHFANAEAAGDVLAHARAFRLWWKTVSADPTTAIDQLFAGRPPGWQQVPRSEQTHFFRAKIPNGHRDWHNEVSEWLSSSGAWESNNFLISPRAGKERGFLVDIYTERRDPPVAVTLYKIATRLAAIVEEQDHSDPDETTRELWRSIADYGLRIVDSISIADVTPVLTPASFDSRLEGRVGYAVLRDKLDHAVFRAEELVELVTDETRNRELRSTIACASHLATDVPTLLLLGSVRLVRPERKEPERAEFDGVWFQFEADRVSLFLLEHKSGGTGSAAKARKDLDKKLKLLTVAHEEVVDIPDAERKSVALTRVRVC